jgi:hypothetical protein
MQEKAYHAIQEVYHGAVPEPHDFDRVEYVKALHTVDMPPFLSTRPSILTICSGRLSVLCTCPTWLSTPNRHGLDVQRD